MRGGVLDPKVRMAVMERDGFRCAHCGCRADTIQHRANKQAGGSKLRDNPANLMAMCLAFNVSAEADTEDARLARANGWKLSQQDDPLTVPVFDVVDQMAYLMDNEYGKHYSPGPRRDPLMELAERIRRCPPPRNPAATPGGTAP